MKENIKNSLIFFVVVLFNFAGAGEKTAGFQFLNRIYSPQVQSLGGVYPSTTSGIAGLFSNPAGCAFLEHPQLNLTFTRHLLDFNAGQLAYVKPLNGIGSLGFGLIYFDYGKVEQVDKFANYTGFDIHPQDFALNLHFANRVNSGFSYGMNLKYIYSKLHVYTATALAADFGIIYRLPFEENFSLGISLRNVGYNLKMYDLEKTTLPTTLSFGITKRFKFLPFSLHGSFNNLVYDIKDSDRIYKNFSTGIELSPLENIIFRAGYNNARQDEFRYHGLSNNAGFSGGFGIIFSNNQLDYSITHLGPLGEIHQFGFSFSVRNAQTVEGKISVQRINYPDHRYQPTKINSKLLENKLVIYWQRMKGAKYNIYGRYENQRDWVILNKAVVRKNYVIFEKPKVKGTYLVKVASILEDQFTVFSDEIKIAIN